MSRMQLNSDWQVRSEELWWESSMHAAVLDRKDGWMKAELPCDIHMPLLENGLINEPLEGQNCYQSEWVEKKSWWFKRSFNINDIGEYDSIKLNMESLDVHADIFLNGIHLGHQNSAFYPFKADIKRWVKIGENTILVRLTTGLERVSDADLARISKNICAEYVDKRRDRGDIRRAFVRKPQYAFGWDWGPRVATCGIMKDVYIDFLSKAAIRSVHAVTKSISGNKACIELELEIENLHPYSTIDAEVKLDIAFDGIKAVELSQEVFLRSGINHVTIPVEIDDVKLWWPNGMGGQNLYTVNAGVLVGQHSHSYAPFSFGVRTLKLEMDRAANGRRLFAFNINGRKVFAKGGNWIPSDSIYARITDEKYDILLKEAANANFNILRVWGGGIFERDIFYEKCDEYGIMLWHDFMFACALYPDDQEWFRHEVEKEIDYQTKRLRNHPSIVLWCGNNENHTAYTSWWSGDRTPDFFGGAFIYNKLAPSIVQKNCPEIPYWNSSPYGGKYPHDEKIGDVHPWGSFFMNNDMNARITPEMFDRLDASFVSEYGYVGPCCKTSTVQYHGGEPLDKNGPVWQHHNNTFEKLTVPAGIARHYADPDMLDIDKYLLYAGLCQGTMLGYSLEAFRTQKDCWGGMFWMYNDCWGEVGWTIIDYYLRRKISYYFVKRALSHIKLAMREVNGRIMITAINDTPSDVSFDLEYGYMSFDGLVRKMESSRISIEPFSRRVVREYELDGSDTEKGVYCAIPGNNQYGLIPAILRTGSFKELEVPEASLSISDIVEDEGTMTFTVTSDKFAHAVHFDLGDDVRLSDEYFDLLPGESRKVTVYDYKKMPAGMNLTAKYVSGI